MKINGLVAAPGKIELDAGSLSDFFCRKVRIKNPVAYSRLNAVSGIADNQLDIRTRN